MTGRQCMMERQTVTSLLKDGIKHTLVPIKEEETTKMSGVKVLLVGGKEFL